MPPLLSHFFSGEKKCRKKQREKKSPTIFANLKAVGKWSLATFPIVYWESPCKYAGPCIMLSVTVN